MVFRFRQFASKNRDHLYLGCVIVLSLLLMVLDQKPPVQFVRKAFIDGFGFFQKSVSWIPRMVTVYQDNKRLSDQLSRFSFREDQYNEMLLENRRFRKLLGFKERNLFQFIPAEIVGRETGNMQGSVYLNIGSDDGCRKNMILVNDRGLVGKIVSVGLSTSIGQLISDPNFRVSAKTQRSRILGIVKWYHGNICFLEGVSQRTDVQVGDLVVTSGYSRIYPAGIAIGRIFQISPDKEGLFLKILLKTEVDFDRLEEVFVIENEGLNQN